MDHEAVGILIRTKLQDGRLPRGRPPRVYGSPGKNEICDACETAVPKAQMLIEVDFLTGGTPSELHAGCFTFHAGCFQIWELERQRFA